MGSVGGVYAAQNYNVCCTHFPISYLIDPRVQLPDVKALTTSLYSKISSSLDSHQKAGDQIGQAVEIGPLLRRTFNKSKVQHL